MKRLLFLTLIIFMSIISFCEPTNGNDSGDSGDIGDAGNEPPYYIETTLIGSYIPDDGKSLRGIYVNNNHAFVTGYDSGLYESSFRFIDITDLTNPTLSSTIDTLDAPSRLDINGTYAYVCDSFSGMKIFDISDPSSISLTGSIDTFETHNVFVKDNYAYLGDTVGLKVVDITDTQNPTIQSTYYTNPDGWGIYGLDIIEDIAYIANDEDGFLILDISNVNNIVLLDQYNPDDYIMDVAIDGDYAFLSHGADGLTIVDVSDVNNITPVTNIRLNGIWSNSIMKIGDEIFINNNAGFDIVYVEDPTSPVIIGSQVTTGSDCWDLFSDGNYVYAIDKSAGLFIYEIERIDN